MASSCIKSNHFMVYYVNKIPKGDNMGQPIGDTLTEIFTFGTATTKTYDAEAHKTVIEEEGFSSDTESSFGGKLFGFIGQSETTSQYMTNVADEAEAEAEILQAEKQAKVDFRADIIKQRSKGRGRMSLLN